MGDGSWEFEDRCRPELLSAICNLLSIRDKISDRLDLVVELGGGESGVGAEENGGVHHFIRAGKRG